MTDEHQAHKLTPRTQREFLRGLEATGRFRRDRGIGRIFHPGMVSLREVVPENSLHILIGGNRVCAHIDRFSPLAPVRGGSSGYSAWRTALHNLSGMARDAGRVFGGHRGDGRCEPACEWVDVDDALIERFMRACAEDAETAALDGPLRELVRTNGGGVRRVPFNVVDEIVDLLDSDEEPWSVQLEARVDGRLDDELMRRAVLEALTRHPMGRARKVRSPQARNRSFWDIGQAADVDPVRVLVCGDDAEVAAAREQLQSMRAPLSTSPPLRVWLVHAPGGDVVMLNLHHAAADGFGALRFLRSVARAYAGDPDPLPDVDLFVDRDLSGNVPAAGLRTRLRRYLALGERLRDLIVPPARLARSQGRAEPGYGIHHVHLDAEETRRVVALDHRGSVNDVLLAALHLAIAAWNARHGVPCRRISVLVPSNLRPPHLREEIMANFSVPARISTTAVQRTSPGATLRAVSAQTTRKKRTGMGTGLLELLNRSWLLPLSAKERLVDLPMLGDRLTDTAVLSNLGNVEEPPSFGAGTDPTGLWFSAPARMPLGLSVGAVTVAGRLQLAFRYRHPQFDADAARRFAECYLDELRHVLQAPADERPRQRLMA